MADNQPIYVLAENTNRKFGKEAQRNNILAIGDSLQTDIAGAKSAGMSALLTSFGIHALDIGITDTHLSPDAHLLHKLFKTYNIMPDAVVTDFFWT